MLIQVHHQTHYTYTEKVGLGVHQLYLLPQYRSHFRIKSQEIKVEPQPDGSHDRQDLAGNWYQQVWFSGETDIFQIQTDWGFELYPFNPFGFIIDYDFEQSAGEADLPMFQYQKSEEFSRPFLIRKEAVDYQSFLFPIRQNSNGLVDFLVNLTQEIYQNWPHLIRHEQNIWEPSFTFSEKKGSCRDLAWMQMDMLRSMGLACRFVSGYAFNPKLDDGHELHAWMEVYLPGAGWIGLDPSLGLLTDHHYIPLAVHPEPYETMPVKGFFFGAAKSSLHTFVDLKMIEP
ncbi:transglutaminase family protein [Algoriphagus limi]|uniref:Transglutaminase family protein n=1 Tax=Algoriphagus limi TaxID=2975273 RepID=A0ABT2G432_9BACT|nr:transglutaminase family protein [Algoriphagus limi]MCS5490023.1 transglutaminase family protein [Algoriphagus limi]